MIQIEIMPAARTAEGSYLATGHAGQGNELICNAVTVIEECLCANLDSTWNIRVNRAMSNGRYELRWHKTDRRGDGLRRANDAAGFAYTGLKALAAQYPGLLTVKWRKAEFLERREKYADQRSN